MDTTTNFARWSHASSVYNEVERLTFPQSQTLIARAHSLRSLSAPDTSAFDNGCGTGVLTLALCEKFPTCPILATDASAGMIDILQTRLKNNTEHDIRTRVLDARNLTGIADDTFTHTFSTFMICLAPDAERIAREMYRVTKAGGVLGLAVWADPYFGYFNTPWTVACPVGMSDHEPVAIMEGNWTRPEEVRVGLEAVGFRDVEVWEERGVWAWGSVGELAGYFFEGGNPGHGIMREGFVARGGGCWGGEGGV